MRLALALLLPALALAARAQGPALSQLLGAAPELAPALSSPAALPRVDGIALKGSPAFVEKTALALAELRRSARHGEIVASLGAIEEWACSGMHVRLRVPTYRVGSATWNADTQWYASTIAHDARHAQLYFEARRRLGREPPDEAWMGVPGERLCLQYQIDVLRELGASPARIAYLERLKENPSYQDLAHAPPEIPAEAMVNGCGGRYW